MHRSSSVSFTHRNTRSRIILPVLASLLAACESGTTPTDTPPVSFSVSTAEQLSAGAGGYLAGGWAAAVADGPLVIGIGSDTLRIDSVRVVLAQATLRRAVSATCGTEGHDDSTDPQCANINAGPTIVKLPLTAGALSLFDVPVPKGTYASIAVRVHQANKGETGPNVVAFLAAHPEWENKSIKADGTFNGVAFHWAHDPPAQLNHTFSPALEVGDAGTNFTLQVNVASWFVSNTGKLIDPNDKTNVFYPQVASHVASSFKLFRDEAKKGHDDGK